MPDEEIVVSIPNPVRKPSINLNAVGAFVPPARPRVHSLDYKWPEAD